MYLRPYRLVIQDSECRCRRRVRERVTAQRHAERMLRKPSQGAPRDAAASYGKPAAFTPAACHTGAMRNVRRITSGESNRILQGNARVGELVEIRTGPRRDQLARRHLILRAVDAVDGDQLART